MLGGKWAKMESSFSCFSCPFYQLLASTHVVSLAQSMHLLLNVQQLILQEHSLSGFCQWLLDWKISSHGKSLDSFFWLLELCSTMRLLCSHTGASTNTQRRHLPRKQELRDVKLLAFKLTIWPPHHMPRTTPEERSVPCNKNLTRKQQRRTVVIKTSI